MYEINFYERLADGEYWRWHWAKCECACEVYKHLQNYQEWREENGQSDVTDAYVTLDGKEIFLPLDLAGKM